MSKICAALFLLLLLPLKAEALDTIYLNVEKNEIQDEKNLIVAKPINLKNLQKLDFDKAVITYKIKPRDGYSCVVLEHTEIPLDELLTKKGITKLIPAAINTYICMNTLNIYGGQRDKVIHHTFNYVITVITDKPFKTATTISIVKELGFDLLLGLGTPDIKDVTANFAGALQAKMAKNSENIEPK